MIPDILPEKNPPRRFADDHYRSNAIRKNMKKPRVPFVGNAYPWITVSGIIDIPRSRL
jgi:hypothetical protein